VIATATVDAPKGSINGTLRNYAIYDNDQLDKAAPWNNVVIAYKNGAPVRIRDIGVAVDAAENNQLIGWQNGRPGILLLIYKQPGANVIETARRVDAQLPKALLSVPPSIKIERVADRTTTIRASVRDVEFTLLLTIALVVMVIFPVPAQRLGDDHSRNHRAAVAAGHRGTDGGRALQPGQSLPDGAHHRRGVVSIAWRS